MQLDEYEYTDREQYDYLTSVIYTLDKRLGEIRPLIEEISGRKDIWNDEVYDDKVIHNMQSVLRDNKHIVKDLNNTLIVFKNVLEREFNKRK